MPGDEDEREPYRRGYDAVSRWYKLSADRPRASRSNEDYTAATQAAAVEIRAIMTEHTKLPEFQKGWDLARQSHSTVDDFIELATLTTMYNVAKTAERDHNAFKLKQPFTLPTNKKQQPCRDKTATECAFVTTTSQFYTGEIKQSLLDRHASADAVSLELHASRKLETIVVNTWYAFANQIGQTVDYAVDVMTQLETPTYDDEDALYLDDYVIFAVASTGYVAQEVVRVAYNNGPLLMSASHILVSITHRDQYGAVSLKPMVYSAVMLAGSYGIEYMVPGQFSDSIHSNDQSLLWVDENGQYTVNRALEKGSQVALDYARPVAHIAATTLSVGAKAFGAVNAAQHGALKIAMYLTVGGLYEGSAMYYRGLDYGSYRSALSQGGSAYAAKLAFYDALAVHGVVLDIASIQDIRLSKATESLQKNIVTMIDYLDDTIKQTGLPVEQVVENLVTTIRDTNTKIRQTASDVRSALTSPARAARDIAGEVYSDVAPAYRQLARDTLNTLTSPARAARDIAGEVISDVSPAYRQVARDTLNTLTAPARAARDIAGEVYSDVAPAYRQAARDTGVPQALTKGAERWIKMYGEMARLAGVPRERIQAASVYLRDKARGTVAATKSAVAGAPQMAADNLLWVTNRIMSSVVSETEAHRKQRLRILFETGVGYHEAIPEADLEFMFGKHSNPEGDAPPPIRPPPGELKEGIELSAEALAVKAAVEAEASGDVSIMRGLAERAAVAEDVGRAVVQHDIIVNMMEVDGGMPQIDPSLPLNKDPDLLSKRKPSIFDPVVEPLEAGMVEEVLMVKQPDDGGIPLNPPLGELPRPERRFYTEPGSREEILAQVAANRLASVSAVNRHLGLPDPVVIDAPYTPLTIEQAGYVPSLAGPLVLRPDYDVYALFNEVWEPFSTLVKTLYHDFVWTPRQPPSDPPEIEPPVAGKPGRPDFGDMGGFNQFPTPPIKPVDPGFRTVSQERVTALRPFMAIAGEDVFTKQTKQEHISDERLRASNAELGMFRPTNWPNGSVDNPVWIAQQVEKDRRFYGGPLLSSHAWYSGGTMVEDDTLYGSYR